MRPGTSHRRIVALTFAVTSVVGCDDTSVSTYDAAPDLGVPGVDSAPGERLDAQARAAPDQDIGARDQDLGAPDTGTLDTGPRSASPDAAVAHDAAPSGAPVEDAAAPAPDAAPEPGEDWGACAVGGAPGRCVDVAECEPPAVATPGFCPGPAHIQCCHAPPGEGAACDPAARPQPNAGLTEGPGLGGCPSGMVPVDAFCIDRYEAALVEVRDDGTVLPWSPYHNPAGAQVLAVSLADAVPQGYIDGVRAAEACGRAGKRLCSDAEWLRACQGEAEQTFPYGDVRAPGTCNDARARHPAVELFPDDPTPFDRIQDPCINQLPDGLARTGAHDECVTAEGVFDLMGNLHEWTADPEGTFRGGFYVDTVRNGPGCLYRTTAHGRAHWDYSTGFRCCADP